MSIKNVGVEDLALIELLNNGKTDAPHSVMQYHDRLGHVDLVERGGKRVWALTERGRKRAIALRACEQQLRQRAANAATGCQIRGVANCSFTMAPRARRS